MNNKPQQSMDLFLLDLAEALGHTSKRDESYGAPFAMTADEALERAAELLEERDEYRRMYKHAMHQLASARAVMAGGK